jgi:hypothetical protein
LLRENEHAQIFSAAGLSDGQLYEWPITDHEEETHDRCYPERHDARILEEHSRRKQQSRQPTSK